MVVGLDIVEVASGNVCDVMVELVTESEVVESAVAGDVTTVCLEDSVDVAVDVSSVGLDVVVTGTVGMLIVSLAAVVLVGCDDTVVVVT